MKYILQVLVSLFASQAFAQPAISSFSPVSGPVGTSVVISGANFSSTPANNIVFFGAVRANVTAASGTSLTVTAPAGASFKPISVTTGGLTAYASRPFNTTFTGSGGLIQATTFSSSVDSATDLHPNGVAIADYDGDGKPDIATPNNYSTSGIPASFSLLRNTSTTTAISFEPRIDFSNGKLTYAIAAGDIDGDGKPDIVVSSISDQNISVFRNTSTAGNISFAPKTDYASIGGNYSIYITDFDGDGKPDIAVTSYASSVVLVFRNTGSTGVIAFAAPVNIPTGIGPRCVFAGDIDGDGKADLAVANELAVSVSIIRNLSTPGVISFAAKTDYAAAASGAPYSVALGDLDNDAKTDIVIGGGNRLSIFRNLSSSGSISLAARSDWGSSIDVTHVAIGDLNGDAKLDVLLASSNTSVYTSNSSVGSISFLITQNLGFTPTPFVIGICDLNADSKADLVNALFTLSWVSIRKNQMNEPTISYFTPTTAASGATVTIIGSNFTNINGVSFGGVPATSFTVNSTTNITAVVANGASGDVTLNTTQYGNSSLSGFTFAGPPVVTSFTPTGAGYGQTVTITGYNFSGATAVSFGGTAAISYSIVNPTTITAQVGAGSTGNVAVTNTYGTGSLAGFTHLPTPAISSFTPTSAGPGVTVTITGNNFAGITAVSFGGVAASSFAVQSSTTMTAVVGNGATGNVNVTNSFGTGSVPGFTFLPAPTITSFSPTSGINGTVVTVTGTNFNNVIGVSVGGQSYYSSYTLVSPTSLTIPLNNQGASGAIVVTTTGGTASLPGFIFYQRPTFTSIVPDVATTGMLVTITGSNFDGASSVTLGGVPVASFTLVSPTTITAIVGAGATGNVVITNPAGSNIANPSFTFASWPIVTSYSPLTGPVGTSVTITGGGFGTVPSNLAVYFGATKATVTSAANTSLVVTVPYGAAYKGISVTRIDNNLTGYNDIPFNVTFAGDPSAFNSSSFAGKVDIPSGTSPASFATGDIDGDGKADIVLAYDGASFISVFRNTSTSLLISFASRVDIPVNSGVNNVILADLNNDGKLDIVGSIRDYSSYIVTMIKNLSTTGNIVFDNYSTATTGTNFFMLAAGDFDMDGKIDLVGGCVNCAMGGGGGSYYLTIYAMKNNSSGGNISLSAGGQFYSQLLSGGSSTYLARDLFVKDMDRDNKPDVVVGTEGNFFLVFKNTSGNFINFSCITVGSINGSNARSDVGIADMDNDSYPDMLTINNLHKNLGNFNFTTTTLSSIGPVRAFADMNGDGKPDYLKTDYSNASIFVGKNTSSTGSINFAAPFSYPSSATGTVVQPADLDADGKPEIIYLNYGLNTISILKNKIGAASLCPGGSTTLISSISTGANFQWQENTGSGFVNISDNANFSGTNTANLQLNSIPSSWYGYQYRCVVDGNNSDVFALLFTNSWTGAVSNAWENPGNWSCGTIPDSNTDVVLINGNIFINSNVTIRTLTINPSVILTVTSGNHLTIIH